MQTYAHFKSRYTNQNFKAAFHCTKMRALHPYITEMFSNIFLKCPSKSQVNHHNLSTGFKSVRNILLLLFLFFFSFGSQTLKLLIAAFEGLNILKFTKSVAEQKCFTSPNSHYLTSLRTY